MDLVSKHKDISASDLEHAVRACREGAGPLAVLLLRQRLINDDDLFFLLSSKSGIPEVSQERLNKLRLPAEVKRLIPRKVAMRSLVVPLSLDRAAGVLSVAMLDPTDHETRERLRAACGVSEVRAFLARRSAVLATIERTYRAPVRGKAGGKGGTGPALKGEKTRRLARVTRQTRSKPPISLPDLEEKVELDPRMQQELEDLEQSFVFGQGADQEQLKTTEIQLHEMLERPSAGVVEPGALPGGDRAAGDSAPLSEDSVLTPLPDRVPAEEQGWLVRDLISSVGVLSAMLEERVDPQASTCRAYGRLCKTVAREAGLDQHTVARIALAAHLYSLDRVLRREAGAKQPKDVSQSFDPDWESTAGLGPSLRMLGARVLHLTAGASDEQPLGVRLIMLVTQYLELRAGSGEDVMDLETVLQLLRTSGCDSTLVDALRRVMADSEKTTLMLK